jgi:hypothetical protein
MQEHGEVGEADEARIAALFREAASGAPPPGFDAAQVAATSRRITRRRRSAVAGAALAVLAVAGVGVVAGLGGPGDATVTAASGQAADEAGQEAGAGSAGDAARAAAPEAAAAPDAGGAAAGSPIAPSVPDATEPDAAVPNATVPDGAAGGGPVPGAAAVPPIGIPLGPGPTDRCADRQDPALRALVEQVLPEVVGAPEGPVTMDCSFAGDRGVSLEVRDGAATGVLAVRYLPPGAADMVPEGRRAPTASGGTVVAYSWGGRAGDAAPFAGRIDAVLAYLAPRL